MPAGPCNPYNLSVTSPIHGVEHAENFPVASWLMPAHLRPAVVDIYRFARHADDLADEGESSPQDRLAALAKLRQDLVRARAGGPVESALVRALVPHVKTHRLDWSRFEALLSAFEQDVTVNRYQDTASLLDYCTRSADPVGHIILALAHKLDARTQALSDSICSALQLINFLQDAAIDWRRGRLYLPLDSLAAQGIGEAAIDRAVHEGRADERLRRCIAQESLRARSMIECGTALPALVGGRIGWELRAIIAGGLRILDKLHASDYDPFATRPRLTRSDAPAMAATILRLRFTPKPRRDTATARTTP